MGASSALLTVFVHPKPAGSKQMLMGSLENFPDGTYIPDPAVHCIIVLGFSLGLGHGSDMSWATVLCFVVRRLPSVYSMSFQLNRHSRAGNTCCKAGRSA